MELFRLLGTIAVDNQSANKAIDETTGKAADSESKLSKVAGKIGGGVVKIAKAGAVATVAAATGIATMTKSAVENYAEYEQLVGGVETLFKDSSDYVVRRAKNALNTAGLSANEYMDTVTSFSASLLQGLGGDTEKASKIADKAIIDMSDNANKMGSDMASIQNAYQGFAKQNYTMLDNLKLGYGGTGSEMARLINDSGVLGDTMTVTADTVNSVSFDKIIEAIHKVQDNMGITGTTAEEASTTISGSITTMKAAWTNLLTGMADPNAEFGELITDLVDSIVTVADNLVPKIAEALPKLVSGLTQVVQELSPYIPELINQLLPPLIDGATALINALVTNLPGLITTLLPVLITAIGSILMTLGQMLPDILQAAIDVIGTLAGQIAESLPEMIPTIVDIILKIVEVLLNNLDMLIDAALQIMLALTEGLINALPSLIERLPEIIVSIVSTLESCGPKLLELGVKLIGLLIIGLIKCIPSLVVAAGNMAVSMVNAFFKKFADIQAKAKEVVEKIKEFFTFKWKLPDIKLPHISVTPKGWEIGDLLKGKVPKLGIDWYAEGGVLKKATVFGMNGDNAMVGGEAGEEAVAPISTLMEYIQQAVSSENSQIAFYLQQLIERINQLIENVGSGDIVLYNYLGTDLLEEKIIKAQKSLALKSGGRA